jgi:hypothetical protein
MKKTDNDEREEGNGVTFKWIATTLITLLVLVLSILVGRGIDGTVKSIEANSASIGETNQRVSKLEIESAVRAEQYRQIVESLRRLERRLGTLPADTTR